MRTITVTDREWKTVEGVRALIQCFVDHGVTEDQIVEKCLPIITALDSLLVGYPTEQCGFALLALLEHFIDISVEDIDGNTRANPRG